MSATTFTLVFLFAATIIITISVGLCHGQLNAAAGCIESEREALLKLKHDLRDPSNRLSSWDGDVADCCRWSGVMCDNFTGHVIELNFRTTTLSLEEYDESSKLGGKISESLLNLKHLRYLDFSSNNFEGIQIPKFLGSMESLRYLNLSKAGFGGMIPHQLGNLTNLQYLILHGEHDSELYHDRSESLYGLSGEIYADSLNWLSGLPSLEFLDLSNVNLTVAFDWLDVINKLPSLIELHLSGCLPLKFPPLSIVNFSSLAILDLSRNMFQESQVPSWIFRLPNLNSLDLSNNLFSGPIPAHLQNITLLRQLDLSENQFNSSIPNWLGGFMHLELLNLGANDLQGKFPNAIGNLTSLKSLDLSYNFQLDGRIPKSFKNLCNLRLLNFLEVKMSQEINEVIEILSGCVSDKLESLILPACQLKGHFTNLIGKFKNLVDLVLQNNFIAGPLPMNLGKLTNSLKYLDLSCNKLNGSLPTSVQALVKLEHIDISANSLKGEVSEIHFANLTNLRRLYASGNQLILRVNPDWTPPFQLVSHISLGSWHVGPQFPTWFRSLKHLKYLDLSNTKISSALPIWFHNWSSRLYEFNLSHNQMHGKIPYLTFDDSGYSFIDLSSNNFMGTLPYLSSIPTGIDLSSNSFSGSIFTFLCDNLNELPYYTNFINFGGNLLSREIPDCWMNWKFLSVIQLNNNHFSGNIPQSIGTLSKLVFLNLRNNHLFGEIPLSLGNCTALSILDLGENKLEGDIPAWLGKSEMKILNLRGNKFHGHIPKKLCYMNDLQILDLANNNLSGTIPTCINNFTAMVTKILDGMGGNVEWYSGPLLTFSESSAIMRKGIMVEYSTTLNFVRSIDLSNNKLSGEIPKEITNLGTLQCLNLSHNFLTGRIPVDVGSMQELESLDFSQNQISGEIPQSMSSISFLSYLNLSNNNLSGKIPSATQLQSFNASSFMGNKLCGPPLIINCRADEKERVKDDNGPNTVDWFYYFSMSITPGFVVGFCVVISPLVLNSRWRHLYFNFLDALWNKILVWFDAYICC